MLRRAGIPILAAALAIGGYLGGLQLTDNFHEVVPHRLYRSAQPSPADIDAYVEKYGIRTIINLRGEQPSEDWYRGEVTEARRLGIEHIDFKMSAHHVLSQEDSERLIAIMMDAPKPILVHCKAGADRTGLASALYLAAVAKAGEEPAEAQISLRYGHISLSVSPSYAMDETFEELEPWLGFPWS